MFMTVVGVKQGHVFCKMLSLQQILFYVSVEFHEDIKIIVRLI